jgi:hypothetical protein
MINAASLLAYFLGCFEKTVSVFGHWGAPMGQGVLVAIVTRWQHFGWAGNVVGFKVKVKTCHLIASMQ